ncbi:hypothetical protein Hypma_001997 [Hypsizygus marmoreus]|uniref:Uncharacterized protein n=1 Tax=Hypsizygus marmoreus TaxID=39966 RepID=A0A369JER2_HYPMA|nr:hypothetical protein Hypma_001997 [Hypsizygus marmoreus]
MSLVRQWRLGQCSADMEKNARMVSSSIFSGDARFILTGSDDGHFRVWKAEGSDKLGVIAPHERAAMEYNKRLQGALENGHSSREGSQACSSHNICIEIQTDSVGCAVFQGEVAEKTCSTWGDETQLSQQHDGDSEETPKTPIAYCRRVDYLALALIEMLLHIVPPAQDDFHEEQHTTPQISALIAYILE